MTMGLFVLKPLFYKKRSRYIITDKKIVIIDPISDFKERNILFSKIKNISCKAGLVEKITRTGRIEIDMGETWIDVRKRVRKDFDVLFGIKNPEIVCEIIKKCKTPTD